MASAKRLALRVSSVRTLRRGVGGCASHSRLMDGAVMTQRTARHLRIGGADGDDMLTRSGLPCEAPRSPCDVGKRFLQLDRLPATIIDVHLDSRDAADTCKRVAAEDYQTIVGVDAFDVP